MVNDRPGICYSCGESVPAGEGRLLRDGNRWIVMHGYPCQPLTAEQWAAKAEAASGSIPR